MTELTLFEVTGSWLSVSAPAVSGNNGDPTIEQVSGLVTFTPRLPRGTTFLVNDFLVTNAYNTLQQVFLISNPISGTFRLILDGFRTVALPYNASAATVKAALAALPPIGGAANLSVTTVGDSFEIEFIGSLASVNVSPLIATSGMLNANGQNCPVAVTVVNQGTAEVIADTAIALPAITARIWNGRLSAIDSVDSPGVMLAANSGALNNPESLIYDVKFANVRFNGVDQTIAPYGFVAPTNSDTVCITSPDLQRLPYSTPIQDMATPALAAVNWRLRAV
jgi:hypothetical protein